MGTIIVQVRRALVISERGGDQITIEYHCYQLRIYHYDIILLM